MQLSNDGLTLWFDTADAPVTAQSITVGARPAHPANAVVIQYRSNGGFVSSMRAAPVDALSGRACQYFRAPLPEMSDATELEVLPMLTCGGRQAPSATEVGPSSSLWHRCPAAPPAVRTASVVKAAPTAVAAGFSYELEFLGAVTIDLSRPPETVGSTAQGIRRNFFIAGGSCVGGKLNARIRAGGGDWLLIQTDGVALPNVRTTWETPDGAVLYGDYYGVCDLGAHGYEDALQDRYPDKASVQFAPRFVTDHPRYAWINRLQCLGIGEVDLVNLVVSYDLYGVRSGVSRTREGAR